MVCDIHKRCVCVCVVCVTMEELGYQANAFLVIAWLMVDAQIF